MPLTLLLGLVFALGGSPPLGSPALAGPDARAQLVPPTWPERLYNPKPLPDDLVVPLPCGGAIVFRPVTTPLDSPRSELVGPFAGSDGTGAHYLPIGKYEVSTLQYRAVADQSAGAPCPAGPDLAGNGLAVAQVGVSRIDAINFAAGLSRWLQAKARDIPPCDPGVRHCLPRVDGKPAFVRLPLDQEWEYAARGGAAVTLETFVQPRYPMPEGLERHAWYRRNADGAIAPIGLRLASPLGLHDLYGNAWEVMSDPYRSDRFPGQIGGDVLRGGGIHSAEEDLRADLRVEVQPYDAAGDVTTADTGFRVVLAAPVVTSVSKLAVPEEAAGSPGARRTVPLPLEPTPAPAPIPPAQAPAAATVRDGRLRVYVDTKSLVLVDGEIKGAAVVGGYLEVTGLAHGTRQVEARAAGYASARTPVEIPGPAPVDVRIRMEPTPERAEALLALTAVERRRLQKQLGELGYTCDPAQDQLSQGCRAMLQQFQDRNGLQATGYMNSETRDLLARQAAERKRLQDSLSPGARHRGVTPPPLHGRYLEIPEPYSGGGLYWMDPDAP